MSRAISFLAEGENEADDAVAWYEGHRAGLGTALRESIEKTIELMIEHPLAFPIIEGSNVRRALVGRFPYVIIFGLKDDEITVLSVFHTSRNPIIWRGRID